MNTKEVYEPLTKAEIKKVLSGIYCSGVITGDNDEKFYPQFYSRYTGHSKTLISKDYKHDSREDATNFAEGYSTSLIFDLESKGELRGMLKNC